MPSQTLVNLLFTFTIACVNTLPFIATFNLQTLILVDSFTQAFMRKNNKKLSKNRFKNNWYVEIEVGKKMHKSFAETERDIGWQFTLALKRHFKLNAHMNSEKSREEIGKDLWQGWTISTCGKRINWVMGFRGNRVAEAASIIGGLGGSAGKGASKVRGDSNYYQLLRIKGLEKRRKNSIKGEKTNKNNDSI